nr:ATPase, T2SS/T4P/T4SS family [uncultured Lichenicoccus sp.]
MSLAARTFGRRTPGQPRDFEPGPEADVPASAPDDAETPAEDSESLLAPEPADTGAALPMAPPAVPAGLPAGAPASIPVAAPEPAPSPFLTQAPLKAAPSGGQASALTPTAALRELRTLCLGRVDPAAVAKIPQHRLAAEMERLVSEIASSHRLQLNGREQRKLAEELIDDMLGLGPLQPLLADDTIADIMVNGPDKVFVERSGKVVLSDVHFRDAAHVTNICQRIASGVGRRVDESSPTVDARLKDGSRVNIVLQPLALDGPYISIRKFSKKPIDFQKLIGYGALTAPVARILEIAGRARLNIVISGGTGSGKTTMMNAISRMIDVGERVVTIEDAAELQLQQPHVVRLETRPASLEGRGEITQRDLVRNALRMRPDRVIIGEVRSGEAFDMLQAMNTGHDGSMSTVHANTTRDALTRIENMVQMGNTGLPSRAIRQQIASAVDLIVQVERQRDGGRRVTQVTEVCGMEGEVVILNDVFQLELTGEDQNGKLIGRYKTSLTRPHCQQRLAYFGLDRAWVTALGESAAL